MTPFQIIFTPTSAAEVSRMPKEIQHQFLGEFRGLPDEAMHTDLSSKYGKLERDGRILYRFRIGDYRVYFERHKLGLLVHRILSKNSLNDFLFRSRLPAKEDQTLADNPKFWDLIGEAEQKA